jgi:putative hydrolase of the HAD superfamily
MIESVRAIVFDAVGTLIHPDPPSVAVYEAVGRKYGSHLSAAVIARRFIAAFRDEEELDSRHGQQTNEARELERWRHIVQRTLDDISDPEACFCELFAHFSRPAAWQCTPGTEQMLTALAERGLVLGVASNYDRRLRYVASGLVALRPIEHLMISSEVGWRKPAAEFFRALERLVGFPGDKILFVGDDLTNDYEGALRAGLGALLFDPNGQFANQPIGRIGRLSDLTTRLAEH